MKKFVPYLLSSVLLLGTVACSGAKTSADAPSTTGGTGGDLTATDKTQNAQDATNPVREKQIESDKRAIDQRNNTAGSPANLADNDVSSLVRNELEKAIPGSQLLVESKDGAVTVSGKVATADELKKIEPTVKAVKGVKGVTVKATVGK